MATYDLSAGDLSLKVPRGTELVVTLDFSDDTSGFTVTSEVYSLVDLSVQFSPNVSTISATAGQHSLTISEANTNSRGAGTYGLRVIRIAPGDVTRRITDGTLEVTP